MRLVVLVFLALFFLLPVTASAQDKQLYMLDFVFLNEGQSLAKRDAYNSLARPVASRHGVELMASFDAKLVMFGPKDLDRFDLWTVPAPGAVAAWGNDPDYKKMAAVSQEVHDFSQLTLYFAREVATPRVETDGLYYIEMMAFDPNGFVGDEFVAYVREMDAIAKEYGITRIASFNKLQKFLGNGPQTHWMNIYHISSIDRMKEWPRDERYRGLAPTREKLFVVDDLFAGIFTSRTY